MKQKLFSLLIAAAGLMLHGCIEDSSSSSSSDSTTMCYKLSGGTLTVNCKPNSIGTCSEDGKTSLGSYDTWDACWDDTSEVLDTYRNTGSISPGPNAIGSSSGSGSGGGSGGGGSGSGSYNYTYSCPGGYGGGGTVPVPSGSCSSQYEAFAEAFGCNDANSFYSTCRNLYSCLGNSSAVAGCEQYNQQY